MNDKTTDGKLKKPAKLSKKVIIIIVIILIGILFLTFMITFICYQYVHKEGDGLLIYKEYTSEIEKRDYVIVPGGAIPDGRPGTQLSRRLDGALYLVENDLVNKIIVSGNEYETIAMKKYLNLYDVTDEDIISDNYSEDTLDTIKRAQQYSPDSTFYVCTQEFFSYRTGYFIKSTDINAKIINSDTIVFQTNRKYKMREYFAATKAVFETKLFKFAPTKDIDDYEMVVGK